jgi:hypothetical protein
VNQNGVLALGNYSATEQGTMEDLGGVTSYVLIDKRFQPSANTDPKYRFNGAEPLFKNTSSTIKFREAPHSNTISIEDGSVSFGSNDVGYHSEGLRWDRNSSPRPGYKWYGGATKIEIPDHISGKGAVNFRCDFNIRLWADPFPNHFLLHTIDISGKLYTLLTHDYRKSLFIFFNNKWIFLCIIIYNLT